MVSSSVELDGVERVLALGFFDGIHLGHCALLTKAKECAEKLGAVPAVLTFDTHPDNLVKGGTVPLINSLTDRADIIHRKFGIDSVIIAHFNENMMRMRWSDFVDMIVCDLSVVHMVAGHDFRFGHKGEGTPEKLKAKCESMGLGCDIIAEVKALGSTISSTLIRELIVMGDMEGANALLGHPHFLTDTVRYGYKLGRTIGAPTINMCFAEGVLVPAHGVYAARVYFDGQSYISVTNVGTRPTVSGGSEVTVESFILDYHGDLYGKPVRVEFHKFLRPEMKFGGIEELKEQISKDAEATRTYFS